MAKLWNELRTEPAVVLYGLNAVLAALVTFGLPLSHDQTAAIVTIATALLALVAALSVRPVSVAAITGGIAVIVTAAAAFGLHVTQAQLGAAIPVLSIVLALVLRQAVVPKALPH